jgi:hypothetical protein
MTQHYASSADRISRGTSQRTGGKYDPGGGGSPVEAAAPALPRLSARRQDRCPAGYGTLMASVVPRTPTIAEGVSSRTASGASLAIRPET